MSDWVMIGLVLVLMILGLSLVGDLAHERALRKRAEAKEREYVSAILSGVNGQGFRVEIGTDVVMVSCKRISLTTEAK